MATRGLAAVLTAVVLGTLGCGAASEDVGSLAEPLVAGSNAAVVSNNIPLQMAPGEKIAVQVVMTNTGAASPANDWAAGSNYALHRLNTSTMWSWTYTKVASATPVNANQTFNVIITAPTAPATYTFGARMRLVGDLYFGQTLSVPGIVVSNATTPQWRCELDAAGSDLPNSLTPNQTRTITLKLNNTGTAGWPAGNFYLRSQDTPSSFWAGGTAVVLPQAVPAGQSVTLSFPITAPSAVGTYSFKRQVSDLSANGIGFFAGSCVDTNIAVGGPPALDAALVSQNFPVTMAPGDKATVSVVLTNTGTQAWTTDGTYGLYTRNTPSSLWSATNAPVTTAAAQGQQSTFSFTITAPVTPGTYAHSWRMRKFTGTDAGYFGVVIDIPVTVDGGATPNYGSSVVTQTIPARMLPGSSGQFRVTFQNTGNVAWSGSGFGAASTNTPVSLWGVTSSVLGAAESIATGQQREFVLSVTAPGAVGTYQSLWQMRDFSGGAGPFGSEAASSVLVTLCGNNTLDAGEVCDDGNWVNGDGCSDVCASESRIVDLLSTAADRTIIGSQGTKQLAPVVIGNLTGGAVNSVVVGENRTFTVSGQQGRNTAGTVTGFTGGIGFLNQTSASVTTGFAFEVLGDTSNDHLGDYGGGNLLIGDVTGDGTGDLILSATGADGVMDGRLDAGEVYVLLGGAGLTGTIDLRTVPAVQRANIIGELAGDQLRSLAVGDLTGDGVADLVLGSAVTGTVYVVGGGATLTGVIDLAAPGSATVYKITGVAATGMGAVATVGDLGGSATQDLLLGAPNTLIGGNNNAGAAYAVFGPIAGNISLALAAGVAGGPDVVWTGQGANDKFGTAVAIGDVTGDAIGDAVITATQARKAGVQVGTADIWSGGLTSGTTFDLTSASPHARLLGRDANDTYGNAVALGDWTGDGVADVVLTASSGDGLANNRDGAGELVVVRGGATLAGSVDLSTAVTFLEVYGAVTRDLLGGRLNALAVGNIDSDARADICVGSQKGGTGGGLTSPGRVDCFRAGN